MPIFGPNTTVVMGASTIVYMRLSKHYPVQEVESPLDSFQPVWEHPFPRVSKHKRRSDIEEFDITEFRHLLKNNELHFPILWTLSLLFILKQVATRFGTKYRCRNGHFYRSIYMRRSKHYPVRDAESPLYRLDSWGSLLGSAYKTNVWWMIRL